MPQTNLKMEGKLFDPETYLSYKRALDDPQFEFVDLLDYEDNKGGFLKHYHSFNPEVVLKLLVNHAMIHGTSPVEFHKEMKGIVYYSPGSKLEQLTVKYDVDEEPAMITFDSINFIFPHYYLEANDREGKNATLGCNSEFNTFYSIMTYLEFAAIIPRGRILTETVRTAIVTMHLCALYEEQKTNYNYISRQIIPMSVLQKLVRRRIDIGVLSDERRVRFLISKQLITPDLHLSFAFKKKYEQLKETSPELISMISERLM